MKLKPKATLPPQGGMVTKLLMIVRRIIRTILYIINV